MFIVETLSSWKGHLLFHAKHVFLNLRLTFSDTMTFWRTGCLLALWQSTRHSLAGAQRSSRSSPAWGMAWAVTQTVSWTTCLWWRAYASMKRWRLSNASLGSSKTPCSGPISVYTAPCVKYPNELTESCQNGFSCEISHLTLDYYHCLQSCSKKLNVFSHSGECGIIGTDIPVEFEKCKKLWHLILTGNCYTLRLLD